ncbi:mediator of RNA polymerase II transcription subunit 11 [Parastagonospora nodorum]|nr:mediator of RNA polymerase II transcription subunit 11 [Parastagonospora nodorum]
MSTEADQTIKEQTSTPAQSGLQSKSSPAQQSQTYNQIAATHIDKLSKINEQIPKLLTYFAAAISQLTNNPVETPAQKDQPDTRQAREQALWMQTVFVGLSINQIREALLTQISDLERYGVIPATQAKYTAQQIGKNAPQHDPEASVKNGGYGDFDVGVLNARAASGQAGGEDVLDRVKAIVEELKKRDEGEEDGEKMAVDG